MADLIVKSLSKANSSRILQLNVSHERGPNLTWRRQCILPLSMATIVSGLIGNCPNEVLLLQLPLDIVRFNPITREGNSHGTFR